MFTLQKPQPAVFRLATWGVAICCCLCAAPASGGLISQYTFEGDTLGTTGATINDSAGSNNGALVGDAVIANSGDAFHGRVISLDGGGDYGQIPDDNTLDMTAAVSLSGWIYETGTTGDGSAFLGKDAGVAAGANSSWAFEVNEGGSPNRMRFHVFGADTTLRATIVPAQNTWHHLAGTYDGSNMRIYFNGSEAAVTPASGAIRVGTEPVWIGRTQLTGNALEHLLGQIDDVGIYDSALTAQEVGLIHGLGLFSGVDQADTGIANVLAAFNAGPGNSATAGGDLWAYKTAAELGNPSTTIGFSGGTAGVDAYVILDASGNGVQTIPEPSTLALSAIGLLGLLAWGRRRR